VIANSDNVAGAIKAAEELRLAWIEEHLNRGWPVPEPGELKSCSGALTLRVPVELHRRLKIEAERQKITINQLASYLLASGLERAGKE